MGFIARQFGRPGGATPPTGGGYIARKFGPSISSTAPAGETWEQIERYNQQLIQAGVEPPKTRRVLGTVNRILDYLRTGEYAVGGLMAGKGAIAGIKEKISPSDVIGITPRETKSIWGLLRQPQFYGALAVDILFDPVTYLTFGFGAGAKITTQAGVKILNKSGRRLFKKAIKQFGEDSAKKMMASRMLHEGSEKYLAKGGLKFMGTQILPRKVVQAPFRSIDWALGRMPLTGAAYKTGKELLKKAFVPFSSVNELPAHMGGAGKFEDMVLKTQKGIRGQATRELRQISKWAKIAKKTGVKDPGKTIMAAIEFNKKTGQKGLDDIADWMSKGVKTMARAEKRRGILARELPNYMRHFLTKEGRQFLEGQGRKVRLDISDTIKKWTARAPFSKTRKYKDAVVNVNNLFEKKYGVRLFEEDAFKAFAQRTVEHIRAVRIYDFLKNTAEEIGIQAPVGSRLITRIGRKAKIVRKLVGRQVVDGVPYVSSSIPELRGFLFPEPVLKHLDAAYQFTKGEEAAKSFLKLYDGVLRVWKGSVTGWFPAFHSRNFIGGMFNNWLAGLKNPLRYRQADRLVRGKDLDKIFTNKLGLKVSGAEIMRRAEDLGVTGAPGMIDTMKTLEEMMRIGTASGAKKIIRYPRVAMEAVEDRLRIPLFLDRWLKGDTLEDAAKQVFRFHFDYAPEGFSAFERNVMRRIIPFYTWTRNNVPLQIEQMLKQPGKYAGLEKMRRLIEAGSGTRAPEERKYLPQWMKEMFIFRLPGESKEGLPRYLQLDLPLEDVNKLPFTDSGRREIIALLSPFLKYPIERIANRNLYFGSDIVNADMPKEFQTAKAIEALKYLPAPIKKFLNFKEVKKKNSRTGEFETRYEMDALKLHALRSVIAGRFYSTLASSTDGELEAWMRLSRVLGGVPIRPVDIEEEKYWRLKKQEGINRNVVNYLKRRGVIPYKTKQKKAPAPVSGGYIMKTFGRFNP